MISAEINCAELVKILKDTKDTLVEKQLNALYSKLKHLRVKGKMLRDEKNKLRNEENLLRARKFKLSDEMQGFAGELLCGCAY